MASRPRLDVPGDVSAVLAAAGAKEDFDRRPPYQRNDYVGWIGRAKTPETRRKRIAQMLRELRQGGVYMGMKHDPSRKAD